MEVGDPTLSSTDIDSDNDAKLDQFMSLTDVNSDSDDNFILVDSENSPHQRSTDRTKLPVGQSTCNSNSYRQTLDRIRPECSGGKHKKSSVRNRSNKSSANLTMTTKLGSQRSDFISDSSSDEDLPVMDSLRARLARKRQNAMASFLPEETHNKVSVDLTQDPESQEKLSVDLTEDTESVSDMLVHTSSGATVLETVEKQTSGAVDFSESSEDEAERVPLSNFLSSPSYRHNNVSKSTELDNNHSRATGNKSTSDGDIDERVMGKFHSGSLHSETDGASTGQLSDGSTDSKATVSSRSACEPTEPKIRKKRTVEEIEENKKKAQEKKAERERIKQAKEAEKQKRKIERESKKQFSLGSCLKFIKVLVDTHIMNTPGFGAVLFKACEELGVTCVTEQLVIPYTIMWKREVTECSMSSETQVETLHNEIIENEVLAIVPTVDFIQMVYNFKQKQKGIPIDGVTLRSYANTIKSHLTDKSVTIVAQGIEQYFRDMKNQGKRQHREAVLSADRNYVPTKNSKQKSGTAMLRVSRVDIEEAVTDTQLQTGCSTFMPETQEDVADLVRRFSKAVAERPAKKDRFDPIFSFHEEGSAGVKVDRSGHGLLKVWKQQLLQFKSVSPDVAQALIVEYPSPQLLRQAYLKCSTEKEAIRLLENIVVRRGAGVLETTRRIGKELSRRIYTFLTSDDPNLVIK